MDHVTEIRKLTGGRHLITLESGLSFPLYGKEISDCGLHEDEDVTDEVISMIMEELLPKRARLRAMHLLEKMDWTEQQLREKLLQSAYPEFIVDDAVGYVKSYRYIDDQRYARNYLESHASSKSMRQMEQELLAKGIEKEIIRQAVSEMELPDEEEQILALLKKKHYNPTDEDTAVRQKLIAYLMRRGYQYSDIIHAMNRIETLDCAESGML
ncbi:MAG: recombination regulator RecX [Lachnospiraceae bacterium]|nr:recombination regulator RecX [Lachnospiraceae bacterium]